MMEMVLVTYGAKEQEQQALRAFEKHWGKCIRVVNNHLLALLPGEIAGNNSHFEFSGYLCACALFEGEGPFVLVNDTLFKSHFAPGWRWLLQRLTNHLNAEELMVWGDIRRDGSSLVERPDPFLASWIFVLPNRASLNCFETCLRTLLEQPLPPASPAYEAFLDAWTTGGKYWSGWHGQASASAIARKKHCIRLEHALSKALPAAGLPIKSMGTAQPLGYALLRKIDRLRTRWLALRASFRAFRAF
jgi:hypothetical protein